jgi:hypothetical protein
MRSFSYSSFILLIGLLFHSNALLPQAVKAIGDTIITQWDNPVIVAPNTMHVNDVAFPAHTITVHGTDPNSLFRRWRSEMREQTRDFSGRRPTVVRGVVIPSLSDRPITVIAEAAGDRREPFAHLTLAFAENDSTPLADDGQQQQYMHELAVRYNQALIQEEIEDRQRDLDRAQRRLDRAGSSEQRTQRRLDRTRSRLERAQDRRVRAETDKAEQEGRVMGLQRAVTASGNDRDQRRLIRARKDLAKHESDVLKYMEQELDLQQEITKYEEQMPGHDRSQTEHSDDVEQIEREIEALRSAHDSMR